MSPKKMRQVATLIKGRPVEEAMNILNFTPKSAAHHMAKVLKAAAANAMSSVGTAKLKAEDLSVSKVFVDEAPTAKRIQFRSMGRVYRIRKRFCHLTIEVEGEPEPEKPKARVRRKKQETAEEDTDKPKAKKTAKKSPKAKAGAKKKAEKKVDEKVEEVAADEAVTEEVVAEEAVTEEVTDKAAETETINDGDDAGDEDKKE
jgi:large subunit ribosomal protein L22